MDSLTNVSILSIFWTLRLDFDSSDWNTLTYTWFTTRVWQMAIYQGYGLRWKRSNLQVMRSASKLLPVRPRWQPLRSIGVSNFSVDDLKELLKDAKVAPAVNQVRNVDYENKEAYDWLDLLPSICLERFGRSSWVWQQARHHNRGLFGLDVSCFLVRITQLRLESRPITHQPGGPLDKPLKEIGKRLDATPEQILLAWVKAKGAVAVT